MIRIIKADISNIEKAYQIRLEMLRDVNNLEDDSAFSDEFKANIKSYFSRDDQTTVIALNDENVITGCATICYISIMPTFSHPSGKRACIMNVYTRKPYRRQGIAKKMLEQLIEQARQKGVTEISLDATELGKPLYECCGFIKNDEGMVLDLNSR